MNGRKGLYLAVMLLAMGGSLMAATYEASPNNLRDIIGKLQPGDVVLLADGEYEGGVVVKADGTKDAPIRIRAVGANALFVGGRHGFCLEGDYIELEGIRVTGAEYGGIIASRNSRGGKTAKRNTGCAIRNCTSFKNGSWGVFSSFSEGLVVEGCECYDQKTEHGIYISNSTDNAVIRSNHSHHNKGCGIQFNGDPRRGGDGVMRYNLVENNVLHDNFTNLNLACFADSIVRNNLIYHCNTKAMSLWDDKCGAEYSSKNNVIINNTIIMDNATRECIQLRDGSTGNTIRNNIFVTPFYTVTADLSSAKGTVLDHNLYSSSQEPERFIWAGEYLKIHDMQERGFCEGAVEAVPTFITARALRRANLKSALVLPIDGPHFADHSNADFRLTAESPAIDAGADDERAGSNDLDGNPRVVGAAVDLGAYEFQPAK